MLKPSFFALSIFVLFGLSHCRVGDDSKFGVVKRYEECVLSRLSRSRFFKEKDRRLFLKAVEESEVPDAELKVGTLLRSFTTAATNLVAEKDTPLQDAYVTVVETCSLSLSQHLAEEVMREVQKILSAEGGKTTPTEKTVLSRRREMPSTPPDVKTRRKRSPQAETSFGSFWQPSESLQTVLSNILMNSNPFLNVFSGSTSRRDAIVIARSMIESGLSDYHFSVVQDAVSSVVNAIQNFPYPPEANDYAIAVANGIASVLDARELSFYADGAGIGNAMVSRLQVMLNNRNPGGSSQQSSFGGASASSFSWSSSGGTNQQRQRPNFQMNPGSLPNLQTNPSSLLNPQFNPGSVVNSQFNPGSLPNPQMNPGSMMNTQFNPGFFNPLLNPGPVLNPPMNPDPTVFDVPQMDSSEEFQGDLAFYLYQSDKIQGAFCNGPFPGAYEMVNEGLSEYGLPVSVVAASTATDSLNSMDTSTVCAQFGNVIAETVKNTLRENNLLQSADAQKIADRMASSISQEPSTGPQEETPVFFEQPSQPAPPQNPDYGMPPFVPMDETQPQGAPETLEPPPQSSESAAMPPQETKYPGEYPLLDPSFAPADYPVNTPTLTKTDASTGQRTSFEDSSTRNQQPENPSDTPQPKSNDRPDDSVSSNQKDELTTTQDRISENTSSTTPDVLTTAATPVPDLVTTPSEKVMDTILKDIFTALRTLNSTSGDKPDTNSDKGNGVTTLPPTTAPEMEKVDSSVAKFNTPDGSSGTTPQEAPVAVELQPSFMSTPSPSNPTTPKDVDDSDLLDPTVVFAHHVADLASSTIAEIRSRQVSLPELCDRLSALAPIVDIPPLDVCDPVALVDFLLNVLKTVTLILKGV